LHKLQAIIELSAFSSEDKQMRQNLYLLPNLSY